MCVFSTDPLLLGNLLVCPSLRKPVSPTLSIPLRPVVLRVELRPCGLSLTTLAHLLTSLFSSCWVLLVGLYGWSFCDSFYRLPSLVDRILSYWRLAPWHRFWEMQLPDQKDNFKSFEQVLSMVSFSLYYHKAASLRIPVNTSVVHLKDKKWDQQEGEAPAVNPAVVWI